MASYSIWVLPESSISLSNGTVLDGVTQGDGGHLVDETLTITQTESTEVFVDDPGSETNFSDNEGGQTLDGAQTIDGVTYASGTRIEAEYQFILRDAATGTEYRVLGVNIINSSPAYGTIEGLAFVGAAPPAGVPLTVVSASEGPRNGGSGAVDAGDIVPVCFCRGTRIMTDRGEVPVETLREGQKVQRQDGSFVAVKRVLRSCFGASDVAANPKLRPVRIRAGALGQGMHKRDLYVSRQHRMVLRSNVVRRMFGCDEVLVAAIRLCGMPGISEQDAPQEVEYFHLLFEAHEVVFAEGAPTESLLLGPEALKSVGNEAREELRLVFPDLDMSVGQADPALFIPDNRQQKQLVWRLHKNHKPVLQDKQARRMAA